VCLPLWTALFVHSGGNLHAFQKPKHAELPDFDRRSVLAPIQVPEERLAATARLKARLPHLHVDYDPILGTPRAIVARDGFLTGPKGQGRGASRDAKVAAMAERDPLHSVRSLLNEHKAMFGHGEEALAHARIKRQHTAKHNGLRSYSWQQEFQGITIYDAVLSAHVTKEGELVSLSSQFVSDAGGKRGNNPVAPRLGAEEAVLRAAAEIGEFVALPEITAKGDGLGAERVQLFDAGGLPGEAEVRLVWLPMNPSSLRLCWQVEITRREGERFRVLIDVESGEALLRRCLTVYAMPASYRVFTSDSPSPFSPGHQEPITNQPPLVSRAMVTLGALSTNASPTGWIHPAENETRGNNVDAHLDRNADDLPDLPRPHGEPFRVFDFPVDFTQGPGTYGDAAVVQLFYWCNWMHDTLYDLGFTEGAGNFQKDNFGRGGFGSDLVIADAQDGSGTDNANYTPADDGQSPRIQMYVFSGPQPNRDGDFDAEIIIHEYVHGLTDRLVGGGGGLGALQSGGMGEGWSDFYALALLAEAADDPHAAYAMGGYATENFFGLKENYYFGIRRYPYSTDLNKNPLTFKDIDPLQAIPHTGVPLNPIDTFNPVFASEVHNQGEVWCAVLWEMRANLVDKHGFAGNRVALQLVTDALKLTPRNPNFLQARDAIILADQVNNGGVNFNDIWRAFAKRGMGFTAMSPDASTTIGVYEAYDLPDALLIVPSEAFVSAAAVGEAPRPNCKTYVVTNHTDEAITWSASATQPWLSIIPSSGELAGGTGMAISVCLNTAEQLGIGSHSADIVFRNETSGMVQQRPVSIRIMTFTSMPFAEDFESGDLGSFWQITGTDAFRVQVTDQNGPRGNHHLTLDNTGNGINSRNEATLGVDLAGYTNVVLTFWAKQFGDEPDGPPPPPFIGGADFDGVAISEDGIRWYEVQSLREAPSSYGELRVDLDEAVAKFGLTYNENFRIRFNEFDNFSIPLDGIAIDDIALTGTPARRLRFTLPTDASEGSFAQGTITLGTAQPSNVLVSLISSDPLRLSVPATVLVPAGSTQAVFTVSVPDNSLVDGSQAIFISATVPGFSARPESITVHDDEPNSLQVRLVRASAVEGEGRLLDVGLVSVHSPCSRDVRIALGSTHPDKVALPEFITLRAGECCAEFDVEVLDDSRLDPPQTVTISAHVENWTDGETTLEVTDNDAPGLTLVVPPNVSEGNGVLNKAGQIRLAATLDADLTVFLSSSDESEIIVPPIVVVPAGSETADFDITVMDDGEIDGAQLLSILATAPEHAGAATQIQVLDDETPPTPYEPSPAHQRLGTAVTADLAWLGGVGEIIRNGGFETGDFTGWGIQSIGLGGFTINDGKLDPQSFDGPTPPFAGDFSIVTDQTGGGHHVLYQDILIPADARNATLRWVDKIRNHSTQYDFNQFFRVEIRDSGDEVLAVLFTTEPGFPLTNDWTARSFDVSQFRGQTVRLAFVEEDHQGYFNIHLDNVSLYLDDNGLTTYDVYFGTNDPPVSADFQGNASTNFWALPDLNLTTTYYWQIVARRGEATNAGPVWQFTTRGVGNVDRFEFGPLAGNQLVEVPFAATVSALDDIDNIETNFIGAVTLRAFRGSSNVSAVVITEIDAGTNDRIEFMNVSGRRINISNWQITTYDSRSWPASRSTITIGTNTTVPFGGVFMVNPFGEAPGKYPQFYTGTNIAWSFSAVSNFLAVLVRDANGEPVDFFCAAGANPSQITEPLAISQDEWSGLPVAVNTNVNLTYQRAGNVDTGSAADWVLATNSLARRNPGLELPFVPRYPLEMSPSAISNFFHGVWSGDLTFKEPAPVITVVADDGRRHIGIAGPFSASVLNDISLSVVDSPDVVTFGDDLTYRFTIANSGPGRASGVVFSNAFAADLTFVWASSSRGGCTVSDTHLVCGVGDLAAGEQAIVTLTMRPQIAGVITNMGSVNITAADGFIGNNTATAVSTVTYPVVSTTLASVNEGHAGTTNVTFNVRLWPPSRLPVSVGFSTTNLSATAGLDYAPTNGVLNFEPGVTNLPLHVVVFGDRLDENFIEQFTLELAAVANCAVATPQVRGRINDDDPTPTLSISDAALTEPEPGGVATATFEVRLSEPSGLTVQVNYTTTNGTALAGRDFYTDFGLLTFAPGVTNQTFTVQVIGDTVFETNESFQVRLFSAENGQLLRALGTATIADNGFVALESFKWEPIASPQQAGAPFLATVTARDGRGDIFHDFNGTVRVSAISASRLTGIGEGTNTSEFPMGTFYHDSRAQVIYLANEIGAAGKINALSLNILAAPGQTLSNWTIRLKHTGNAAYAAAAWETNDWTMVYQNDETIQGTGWTTFFFDQPFSYDGTNNLLVDISFDNDTYTIDGICASFVASANRAVSFQTDGAFGDPLRWAAASPPGALTRELPQIRFTIENFVAVAPAQIGPFVNGAWTGELSVLQPGTNVVLRAQNDSGRTGNSTGFAVQSAGQSYIAITRLAQGVRLRFETVAGLLYRVEASDSPTGPVWTLLGQIPGTGSEEEVPDTSPTTRTRRFYRVVAVP
jgi:uncharacterized repeat protein (TIGR01451 family)